MDTWDTLPPEYSLQLVCRLEPMMTVPSPNDIIRL